MEASGAAVPGIKLAVYGHLTGRLVGSLRSAVHDARYAIIERRSGRWQAALHSVPYDFAAAARQAQANGFAQWTDALTTGWAGPKGLFG